VWVYEFFHLDECFFSAFSILNLLTVTAIRVYLNAWLDRWKTLSHETLLFVLSYSPAEHVGELFARWWSFARSLDAARSTPATYTSVMQVWGALAVSPLQRIGCCFLMSFI
jgi:hypothetical protein